MQYQLTINQDPDAWTPCSDDGWAVYPFSYVYKDYGPPDRYIESVDKTTGNIVSKDLTARKIKAGTAFYLSRFAHGAEQWYLRGEAPNDPWDCVSIAGIMVWEADIEDLGPKTFEARKDDARNFINTWSDWVNGYCYSYKLQEANVQSGEIDTGYGYIGAQAVIDAINENLMEGDSVVVDGDSAHLAEFFTLNAEILEEMPV